MSGVNGKCGMWAFPSHTFAVGCRIWKMRGLAKLGDIYGHQLYDMTT